ncbi:MAG: hypothetical protein RPR97_07105 [Colwellia sp.]
MITTLTKPELYKYLSFQLNAFFPDKTPLSKLEYIVDKALLKLQYCFAHVVTPSYSRDCEPMFNHLNSDHYTTFIYYCSNVAYQENCIELASKLFYLNKTLNSFHCMYDTELPDIFLVFHAAGTILGKAKYSNYFICLQGCTVGANADIEYPTLDEFVLMYPNSSIIGDSNIGKYSCIASGAFVNDSNVESNKLVIDRSPNLIIKESKKDRFSAFFKID